MQARLHRHRFNPPLLSHITVIHPEIHAGHRIDTLPQELQHVPDLLDVMLQCFPFPVRCQFAGHEHPDLCLISIHAGIHQLCVLFLDHFSVKIQIQDIPEVFQLFRIQMRRHFCEHILDDFFYHNKPLLYTDIVKDRGFLCQLLTQLYSDLNTTNNNLSNGSVKSYFSPHKNNEADLCKGYNNSDGVFYFNYQGALVPIKKYVFSDGQGNGIFSSDQLVKNSDLPKNFKFLNLKYNTASSYDTEVLKYIESLKESVFIIYCQHGSASMYMGFIVGDGKYGTVLRFEYDSLYVNGCSGNAWAGWTKLG